jgi:NADPH:quinone reductase-like Zn-dependent oxidoreductase
VGVEVDDAEADEEEVVEVVDDIGVEVDEEEGVEEELVEITDEVGVDVDVDVVVDALGAEAKYAPAPATIMITITMTTIIVREIPRDPLPFKLLTNKVFTGIGAPLFVYC